MNPKQELTPKGLRALIPHSQRQSPYLLPKRPYLGKASPMLEGFKVLLSPDLFSARLDAISDVHSNRLPALFDHRDRGLLAPVCRTKGFFPGAYVQLLVSIRSSSRRVSPSCDQVSSFFRRFPWDCRILPCTSILTSLHGSLHNGLPITSIPHPLGKSHFEKI